MSNFRGLLEDITNGLIFVLYLTIRFWPNLFREFLSCVEVLIPQRRGIGNTGVTSVSGVVCF